MASLEPVGRMRTLHVGLRVTDLARSLGFYTAIGYQVVGRVPATPLGDLTMLKLPQDEFVTVELVSDPPERVAASALSHIVIQVDSLAAAVARLTRSEINVEVPASAPPASGDGPQTAWLTDPDGVRIELVQWPAGHPDGLTEADWTD